MAMPIPKWNLREFFGLPTRNYSAVNLPEIWANPAVERKAGNVAALSGPEIGRRGL
jgi:hypothetical protein